MTFLFTFLLEVLEKVFSLVIPFPHQGNEPSNCTQHLNCPALFIKQFYEHKHQVSWLCGQFSHIKYIRHIYKSLQEKNKKEKKQEQKFETCKSLGLLPSRISQTYTDKFMVVPAGSSTHLLFGVMVSDASLNVDKPLLCLPLCLWGWRPLEDCEFLCLCEEVAEREEFVKDVRVDLWCIFPGVLALIFSSSLGSG